MTKIKAKIHLDHHKTLLKVLWADMDLMQLCLQTSCPILNAHHFIIKIFLHLFFMHQLWGLAVMRLQAHKEQLSNSVTLVQHSAWLIKDKSINIMSSTQFFAVSGKTLLSSFSHYHFTAAFIISLLFYLTFEHGQQSRLWQLLCTSALCWLCSRKGEELQGIAGTQTARNH